MNIDLGASGACVGVVLAGGLSSRMGRDKALLDWHGKSLLQHQFDTISVICRKVVVSGSYTGFDCVEDTTRCRGPLGGILSVAEIYRDSALLIIPVDMPLLTVPMLSRLMESGVSCSFSEQPLPAFFPNARRLIEASEILANGLDSRFSIKSIHCLLASLTLQSDIACLVNANTPEQWRLLALSV